MRAACALRIFSGKIIFICSFETPAGVSKLLFHGRGRKGKWHLQRRFLRKRGAAGKFAAGSQQAELPQSKPDGFASSLGEGAFGMAGKFPGVPAPPGGAVAQRLRGFESAEPEKTVKRSSRRTGVNLQFFPVQPSSLGLKGASSPFFVAPARRNRWHFSGSLLVSKENIPRTFAINCKKRNHCTKLCNGFSCYCIKQSEQDQTSSRTAISAASPRRAPILMMRV